MTFYLTKKHNSDHAFIFMFYDGIYEHIIIYYEKPNKFNFCTAWYHRDDVLFHISNAIAVWWQHWWWQKSGSLIFFFKKMLCSWHGKKSLPYCHTMQEESFIFSPFPISAIIAATSTLLPHHWYFPKQWKGSTYFHTAITQIFFLSALLQFLVLQP